MKTSRILSALFVMLALALGALTTGACTTTDNGASAPSGSSGGY